MEKEIIRRALQECGGNQVKASTLLGITGQLCENESIVIKLDIEVFSFW